MAKLDPQIVAHLEWIGFVRPTGLVVSAPALVRAGAILDRRDTEGQQLLRECVQDRAFHAKEGPVPFIADFRAFAGSVLGWNYSPKGYAGIPENPIPPELELALPEYGEVLRPDYAVRELEPQDGCAWQLLVRVLEPGEDFDAVRGRKGGLEASEHSRLDRLLRQTRVPAGVLFNGRALRLISAPYGESSGWIDFRVADMVETAGRPISTALRLLLGQSRLLSLPRAQRLSELLHNSRKFQNEVSERLAEQVLHALYELLRGFQSAHDASASELLRGPLAEHPDEVYRALLTVILRLVFLLYAEERDMLPEDDTFLQHYSIGGLYERLREDAALFPDTMDLRYGAWAQLLVLFRMIHDGAETGSMRLPRRHGVLFDPDRFRFLEGRIAAGGRQIHERIDPPLVPDGTIYRALEKLLVLDGERISYRALDVEQIGSVYETMMGFRLETGTGRSVAIKAQKKQGAPTAVDLEALLREPAAKRDKWVQEHADRKVTDSVKKALAAASKVEDLHAALLPVIDLAATPDLVPKGAMILQPSEERRCSGSHYTPRELTEPIVRTTLEPILARLRGSDRWPPSPAQILDLKVCDPAMGSGAFLVEACRQLGDALVEAWHAHGEVPTIPPDEDEVIFARRLVAQRCLYGVDRNPVAVDLAKVSLWLVTLARDHALTFVDHALRHGDSLIGLSRKQIESFHWDSEAPEFQAGFEAMQVRQHLARASDLRQSIREADEAVSDWERRDLWDEAQLELAKIKLFGDLVVEAFFDADKPKNREAKRREYANAVVARQAERYRSGLEERRRVEMFAPFHWEVEFPEVFQRGNPGFDAVIGNPPFLGGKRITGVLGDSYKNWLAQLHKESSGNADLVSHFFRRAFSLIRDSASMGLVATNTISQGDTRRTGLRWIGLHNGTIYRAWRRYRWPGSAAVVVSIVWIFRGHYVGPKVMDRRAVDEITAFLFHRGGHEDPERLKANEGVSFIGCDLKGQGFLFDDDDPGATSLATMRSLITGRPELAQRIHPYIGGEEINDSPTHDPSRYVIDLNDLERSECAEWEELFAIVDARVRPERLTKAPDLANWPFWRWWRSRNEMRRAVGRLKRMLVIGQVSRTGAFTFLPSRYVPSHKVVVFAVDTLSALAVLQSRVHDVWARFFSSSFKDDLSYTPSDCFENFPFPMDWVTAPSLERAGEPYYDFRALLMVQNNEGLTKTYNRFHDPLASDPEILRLRVLHADMDRAVLDAYGWNDIKTDCEFLLDYEIDEDEWGDKRKPYRYRWPDDVRDEVLARLLELNAERAKEEARSGAAAEKGRGPRPVGRRKRNGAESEGLFS
jgi:hypothetical protein